MRYLGDPKKRRASQEILWEGLLSILARRNDIDLAYPPRRFYNNAREGKPDLVPGATREVAD